MRIALGFGFSALVITILAGMASGVGLVNLLTRGALALAIFALLGGLVGNLMKG